MDSSSPSLGVKIKKMFELPPPRQKFNVFRGGTKISSPPWMDSSSSFSFAQRRPPPPLRHLEVYGNITRLSRTLTETKEGFNSSRPYK